MSADTTTSPAGHMTLWEHLAELRSRLFRVAAAVAVGAVLGWFLYPYVLEILKHPFNEVQPGQPFIATEPLQAFTLRLKMSGYIGKIQHFSSSRLSADLRSSRSTPPTVTSRSSFG